MPRGVLNWNFKEVESFLRDHHFSLNHVEGSHYFYVRSYKGLLRQVSIPFHGKNERIDPKTIKSIIAQSGVPKEEWFNW